MFIAIFTSCTHDRINFIQKNSELGLPLFYYEPNTFFNFKLIDANNDKPNSTSINYSIDEIVNLKNYDQNYKKNILINNTILLMNLSLTFFKVLYYDNSWYTQEYKYNNSHIYKEEINDVYNDTKIGFYYYIDAAYHSFLK